MGLQFIGIVKTATKQYPMSWLSSVEMENRGDRRGLVSRDKFGRPNMLAFVWMDWDRHYFVASGSLLDEGIPYWRECWRQVSQEPNASPEKVELFVPRPKVCQLYFETCLKIDQSN